MINITEKSNCCGCSACVQRCPKQCITLKEDEEGFFYPQIDKNNCIECNLCEKVCPLINPFEKITPIKVLAVKNRNEEERLASSSGGVFIALAKYVISHGGVVFGAVFDEKWEVKHTYTETIEGIRPMMGSKYLQSRIENTFSEAELFLKQGRKVMFIGTPCQITGLKKYLRKEYSNLLAVDVLCHGVPSPRIWRKYLNVQLNQINFRCVKSNATEVSSIKIDNINFRDKKTNGWKDYRFVIYGKYKSMDKKILLSESHNNNTFIKGFLSNVYLRPSCYNCRCKNGVSQSDLTLADFWGIDWILPDFYDDKGVSLVLVNSEKGDILLYSLNLDINTSAFPIVKKLNGGFKEKIQSHPKRRKFFKKLKTCENLINLINECSKPTFKIRLLNKINYINQKLLKWNHQ